MPHLSPAKHPQPFSQAFNSPAHLFSLILYHSPPCFSSGSVVKNPSTNAGDTSLIPGLGRSPGEGNSIPLHHSCLGNPMDRGARRANSPGGSQKSQTQLSNYTTTAPSLITFLLDAVYLSLVASAPFGTL